VAVRVVGGVEQPGDAREPPRFDEARVKERHCRGEGGVPEHVLGVHDPRMIRPQAIVEMMRQRRKRAPERHVEMRIGDPRKPAGALILAVPTDDLGG
jgi:hypothetical protein